MFRQPAVAAATAIAAGSGAAAAYHHPAAVSWFRFWFRFWGLGVRHAFGFGG